jgi:hypothetical protein
VPVLNQQDFHAGQTMVLSATLSPGSVAVPADVYIVLRTDRGSLLSLQGDGRIVPGVLPIARGVTPARFTGEIVRYTFQGDEPVGTHAWLGAIAQAGTARLLGPVDQKDFTVGH